MKKYICIFLIAVFLSGCGANHNNEEVRQTQAPTTDVHKTAEPIENVSISPEPVFEDTVLNIDNVTDKYSYENMMDDIATLQKRYKDIQVIKLCETVDGRDVCDVIIGNQQSADQVLIMGSMHAREYITTDLVMTLLCNLLENINNNQKTFKGKTVKELMENVTVHFVPMVNPDGVSISQFGADILNNSDVKSVVRDIATGDYSQWKANAEGIDINRNFDAGWNEYQGSPGPAPDRYKGIYPGCTNEAAAMIKLTEQYKFKRTISYHTCGALIYWYYKQTGDVLQKSQSFANAISESTGYPLDGDYTAVDAAGYKDWAVYKMGIPSITIEVGSENGGGVVNPVPYDRFDEIKRRNADVVYATVHNLKYGE